MSDDLVDTMSRALSGILSNPNMDVSKEQAARAASAFGAELVEAFDSTMEDSEDFDEDGEGVVWEMFLATVTPTAMHASPDDFRSREGLTELASTCLVNARAAWDEFKRADGEDDDEDEEEEEDY